MTPYTLKQASELLQSKQISAVELAGEYLKAIAAHNAAINGYITLDEEKTLAEARAADERIAAGEATALTGVPVAYKDIFCQTGWRSACASKMLDNFISPYTATNDSYILGQSLRSHAGFPCRLEKIRYRRRGRQTRFGRISANPSRLSGNQYLITP